MQADTGMKLVLVAGSMTFANEWYQAHEINWRIPVATVLAAAIVAGVGKVSPGGGAGLGVMALIVAAVTPLNGKSPVQQLTTIVGPPTAKGSATTTQKVS
jgi:hypothetical protein